MVGTGTVSYEYGRYCYLCMEGSTTYLFFDKIGRFVAKVKHDVVYLTKRDCVRGEMGSKIIP
jgi:hypothetical protein